MSQGQSSSAVFTRTSRRLGEFPISDGLLSLLPVGGVFVGVVSSLCVIVSAPIGIIGLLLTGVLMTAPLVLKLVAYLFFDPPIHYQSSTDGSSGGSYSEPPDWIDSKWGQRTLTEIRMLERSEKWEEEFEEKWRRKHEDDDD